MRNKVDVFFEGVRRKESKEGKESKESKEMAPMGRVTERWTARAVSLDLERLDGKLIASWKVKIPMCVSSYLGKFISPLSLLFHTCSSFVEHASTLAASKGKSSLSSRRMPASRSWGKDDGPTLPSAEESVRRFLYIKSKQTTTYGVSELQSSDAFYVCVVPTLCPR